MLNILVVDDNEFNRILLSSCISGIGHNSIEACNGLEAVNIVKKQTIDVVFLDISMPVMNGLEACKRIKRHNKDKFIPIIFVTGMDDSESMSEAISAGGDDFIVKPIDELIVASKLKAHQRTLSLFSQINNANKSLDDQRKRIDQEHKIVERIFTKSIHRVAVDCANVKYHTSPMSMFNGDTLLISPSPSGGVYALIGDFTGHGLSAAVGCLPVSDIFYAMANKQANVSNIAVALNDSLLTLLPDSMFFCAAIIELNQQGDRLSLWLGGMIDALLVGKNGGVERRIASKHMPLGILSSSEFESTTDVICPGHGQKLYIFTDGIVEARNTEGDTFGEQRLGALMQGDMNDRLDRIFRAVANFQANEQQEDDITLIEITCNPVTHITNNVSQSSLANDLCPPEKEKYFTLEDQSIADT